MVTISDVLFSVERGGGSPSTELPLTALMWHSSSDLLRVALRHPEATCTS